MIERLPHEPSEFEKVVNLVTKIASEKNGGTQLEMFTQAEAFARKITDPELAVTAFLKLAELAHSRSYKEKINELLNCAGKAAHQCSEELTRKTLLSGIAAIRTKIEQTAS